MSLLDLRAFLVRFPDAGGITLAELHFYRFLFSLPAMRKEVTK